MSYASKCFVALPNGTTVGWSTICECEFLIIRRLVVTFMYYNRLHIWMVENFAVLFDCTRVGLDLRLYDGSDLKTYLKMRG